MSDFRYTAPPTIAAFMAGDAFVRCLMGPFGSGKSTGCSVEILVRAQMQKRSPDGIRHSRWGVVRNTYRELQDTTKRTIEEWIPAEIRTWVESEATFYVRFNDVQCEIILRALDRPEDVKKLLSLELTGAWFNEAREIPKAILDAMTGRVGRFPSAKQGGCSWSGIWMDTNPCDDDHWIYKLFEEFKNVEQEDRHMYRMFHQPSGLAPNAENINNLLGGARNAKGVPLYYARMMVGKTKEFIDVFVHGRYGFVREGKPVYPEYIDELHTLKEPPLYLGGMLTLGMDFGLTPAIIVLQRTPVLQWQAIREYVSEDMGATRFAQHVKSDLMAVYPRARFRGWGDPAGTQRSQVDERTPYDVVQAAGLPIDPAGSNDFIRRVSAVSSCLTKLTMTGVPSLVVSPECKTLRKAMNGGYHYARVQVSGADERYRDAPVKNQFSHIAEATQYGLLGEGMDIAALDDMTGESSERRRPKVKMAINRRGSR